MKKITFLMCLLVSSLGFSQVVLEDFESSYPASDLMVFEGAVSATTVADPVPGGTNGQVLEIVSQASGNPWQGASMLLQDNYVDLAADQSIQLDVYSTSSFGMLVVAEDPAGAGAPRAGGDDDTNIDYVGGSGWQTITVTLNQSLDGTAPGNDEYEKIVFFTGWNNAADAWVTGAPGSGVANTVYIDNIRGVQGSAITVAETCDDGEMNQDETGVDCGGTFCPPCAVPPTTPAPTPPNRAPADVLSIYSDAYTDIGVDTYDTPWCPGTTSEVMIGGNATQLLTGASCDGIEWISSRTIDATDFTHFHIDFYTDEVDLIGKVFNMKFSEWGGTGGEVSALEFNINDGTSPSPQTGAWVSVDIDLTSMDPVIAGSLTRSDIVQFVFSTNLNQVWWDNLYLHKDTVLSTDNLETASFRAFPNPTNGDWNITGNSVISKVAVYDILGKQVIALEPNATETIIDASSLNSGIYFARVEGLNGSKTVKLIKE